MKLFDKPLADSTFNWRADKRYQTAAMKLADIGASRDRLQRELQTAIARVATAQAEVDGLQLATITGQAAETESRRADDELRVAIGQRDAVTAELARVDRLIPGVDRIEKELAHETRQPYAKKFQTVYRKEVEAQAVALRQAADASARVQRLHDMATLHFESKDLQFHPHVAGAPLAHWPELDMLETYSKIRMWLDELRSYGFEV